jgi:serine protease Do
MKNYTILLLFFSFFFEYSFSQDPTILRTNPSGATVFEQENELGETPFDLKKLKKDQRKIVIRLSGYDPVAIKFSDKESVTNFPGTVVDCEFCTMETNGDKPTGVLFLRKKLKERDYPIMVSLDTAKYDIPIQTEIGKINSNRILMSDDDVNVLLGNPENMQLNLINPFGESYIETYFISTTAREKTSLYNPKIILKPVVEKLNFTLKGKLLRDYTGPVTMECTWLVSDLSDKKKVLGSFTISTSVYRFQGNYNLIMHHMLSQSERDLLEIDTLYDFLSRIEKEYLGRSKKEVLKIKSGKINTFNDTKEMLKNATNSVVTIENDEGFGSGSIISEEGYILTSYHVVENEKNIYVRQGTNEKVKATIVRVNKDYDLALLKADLKNISALGFGNSDNTDIGDEIFAAGTPIDKSLRQTVTRGIVSGHRQWNGVNFLQTDVSINSGNSGGPMFNSKGEIIAITTMKRIGRGIEGIGFGIPSNVAVEMLNLKFE